MSPLRLSRVLVVVLLAAVSLSACGGTGRDAAAGNNRSSDAGTRPASSAPQGRGRDATTSASTSVRISFGDTELRGRLLDNATARDLAAQLPLTLTFSDLSSVEKAGPLPHKLSIDGAPAGHDPVAGDIGYWAPDGNLVLYYDDQAPFWNGIVLIGKFHGDMTAVKGVPDRTRVRIEAIG